MDNISKTIEDFKLPDYETIPDVGLYLEQTVRFISEYLEKLPNVSITNSMIGNYVKKGLIDNPVKKLYKRDQIGYLIFIAIAKTVLSLEDIQILINMQKQQYEPKTAYEYFVREFTNMLHVVFGLKDKVDDVGLENTNEKTMLRNTIITISHKIYLDKCFEAMNKNKQ